MKRSGSSSVGGTATTAITVEDRIALAINRIYDKVATLHGAADPPSDMELRQSVDSNTWQIRAYRYGGCIRARDYEILHEAIERCPVFGCVQGHRVYFNSSQCSSQTETHGALIVHLCIPAASFAATTIGSSGYDDEYASRAKRHQVRALGEEEDG
jgi:hypothetical protein